MIINIRGTSGSGKSTLVRSVMSAYADRSAVSVPGRKQPLFYICRSPGRYLMVPGHYEGPCGGCDTIKSVREVYEMLAKYVVGEPQNVNVLYEGLLASEDQKHCLQFHRSVAPVDLVVNLSTPIEDCLRAVAERRRARGDERPLDPKNTTSRVRAIKSACAKLDAAGVRVEDHDRKSALERVLTLLKPHEEGHA